MQSASWLNVKCHSIECQSDEGRGTNIQELATNNFDATVGKKINTATVCNFETL
jgi:hypothetical protein